MQSVRILFQEGLQGILFENWVIENSLKIENWLLKIVRGSGQD